MLLSGRPRTESERKGNDVRYERDEREPGRLLSVVVEVRKREARGDLSGSTRVSYSSPPPRERGLWRGDVERGKALCVETLRGSRGEERGSSRHAGEGEQQQRAAARTVNNQDAHARHHDLRNHHEHRACSHGGAGEERPRGRIADGGNGAQISILHASGPEDWAGVEHDRIDACSTYARVRDAVSLKYEATSLREPENCWITCSLFWCEERQLTAADASPFKARHEHDANGEGLLDAGGEEAADAAVQLLRLSVDNA